MGRYANEIARQKRKREESRAKGLCWRCHCTRDDLRYRACSACRQKLRQFKREARAKLREKGLCLACCKAPIGEGRKSHCDECARKQTRRSAKFRSRKRAAVRRWRQSERAYGPCGEGK